MRDPAAPPDDFVAFVERRGAALHRATRAAIGNDQLADLVRGDLLVATALRWRRLRRADRRADRRAAGVPARPVPQETTGRPDIRHTGRTGAADAYLRKVFLHTAAALVAGGTDGALGPGRALGLVDSGAVDPLPTRPDVLRPGRARRRRPDPPVPPARELAAYAWAQARRTRRRRIVALVSLFAAGLLAALGPAPATNDSAPRPASRPAPRQPAPAGAVSAIAVTHPPDPPPVVLGCSSPVHLAHRGAERAILSAHKPFVCCARHSGNFCRVVHLMSISTTRTENSLAATSSLHVYLRPEAT